MTLLLAIDPGLNSGVALGRYSATEPFALTHRWQVHGGLDGWMRFTERTLADLHYDEIVVEKFVATENDFVADISGVPIEGVIAWDAHERGIPIIWQTRAHKGSLLGYPDTAKTKAQRQRVRFDFLERHGMFKRGTENDDSNDAAVHALVSLKLRRHMPTLTAYWGRGRRSEQEVAA